MSNIMWGLVISALCIFGAASGWIAIDFLYQELDVTLRSVLEIAEEREEA